jgi:GTPase SAR1 family protein
VLKIDNLIIIGPAGSGKSTLSRSMGDWLESAGHRVAYLNLDPGADYLPYVPDFDARELVTVESLMKKEGLGPNGALIRAADVLEGVVPEIIAEFERRSGDSDFRIIDTPGQMEVFIFRGLGPKLASALHGRAAALSIIDPSLLKNGVDLVVLKLLGLVVELRLGVPSIDVMNKTDLYGDSIVEKMEREIAGGAFKDRGLSAELADQLYPIVNGLSKRRRAIPVSAKKGTGMEDLYKAIGESFCACGDLT